MRRYLLIAAGFLCLGLGFIGAFFPIMPTTPFVLLAAFLFTKSSPEMYERVKRIPWLGKFIAQYSESETISTKARVEAIAILWIGLAISGFVVRNQIMTIVFFLIGVAVTIHLITIKRKPKPASSDSDTQENGLLESQLHHSTVLDGEPQGSATRYPQD